MSQPQTTPATLPRTTRPLRVAVTGGSGRIGSVLIHHLAACGHQPTNLDLKAPAPDAPGHYVQIDLRDREQLEVVLREVDAVCHLGEIPNVGKPYRNEEVYAHNTAVGSLVLQCAADLKLQRVIYVSTCQVYGTWGYSYIPAAVLPMDETHPLRPQNAYAAGKVANEGYACMVAQQSGMPVSIFRFPWVIDHDLRADEAALWDTLAQSKGPAEGMATYLHVSDAARAFSAALESARPDCEIYHFTAVDVLSAEPIRERLLRNHPDCPRLPADWPLYGSPVLTTKANQHLGWHPQWSITARHRSRFGCWPHEKKS